MSLDLTSPTPDAIAVTPSPPYTAVIFTSVRTADDNGYEAMADRMAELAAEQPGYLGIESAGEEVEITVSYWQTEDHAKAWKLNVQHAEAQRLGREKWYSHYVIRIATVTRDYGS